MSADSTRSDTRGRLWRSRWAAIGAAVAVTFGAGGLAAVNAAGGQDSTTVLTDPVRVLDSRDPLNVGLAGPFASQVSQKLQITGSIPTTSGTKTVVPTGATGVLLNVTAVAPTANGFVSIRPGDATGTPSTSSLNVSAGQIVPNAVLVALPTSGANAGTIEITYDAFGVPGPTTDILIDVVGHTTDAKLKALEASLETKVDAADLLFATIAPANSSPAIVRGSGVTNVEKTGVGWRVRFNRDVSECTWMATYGQPGNTTVDARWATTRGTGVANEVFVVIWDSAGASTDGNGFHISVLCPEGAPALTSSPSEVPAGDEQIDG